jgi:hypothetical protein
MQPDVTGLWRAPATACLLYLHIIAKRPSYGPQIVMHVQNMKCIGYSKSNAKE